MRVKTEHWLLLLSFCETNPELVTNRFQGTEGRAKANVLWQNVATKLNSLGFGEKTVESWRKAFTDWKSKTKSKAAALKREQQQTGGGSPQLPPLSNAEEKLLEIMGSKALDGDELVPELGSGQVETSNSIEEGKENISTLNLLTEALHKTPNIISSASQQQSNQDVIFGNKTIKRKLDYEDKLNKKMKTSSPRNRRSFQVTNSLLELNRETIQILKDINKNTAIMSRSLENISSNTESIANSLLIIAGIAKSNFSISK